MKLSAVLLARVLGYVESADLDQRGKLFGPDLDERFKFQKFPQTLEQLDEAKGIEFHEGKIGNKVIHKFVIWNTIMVVETRSSTTEARKILEELLIWGVEKFGIDYKPGSDLSFYSDVPILDVSPAVTNLAVRTSKLLSEIWQEPIQYEPSTLQVAHDPMARKYGIAPFAITRRAEAKFEENKYFSEAPLPTDVHLIC